MKSSLLILLVLVGCSNLRGPTPGPSEAALYGYRNPCDRTLLFSRSEGEELSRSLIIPNAETTVYFEFEGGSERSEVSGGRADFRCANVVTGTITFIPVAGRYYRPSLIPVGQSYEITLYQSSHQNGVPGQVYDSTSNIQNIRRRCRFYSFCSY